MPVLCAFISPFRRDRALARSLIPEGRFFEIYTKCSLEVCKQRDPKGLYQKALAGEIEEFTGISSPYEEPETPDVVLDTDQGTVEGLTDRVLEWLKGEAILRS